jgi:tetratricopeptide (TPR) repeat protein
MVARDPRDTSALLLAAEAASRQHHLDDALKHYRRIPDDCTETAVSAQFGSGEILIHQGRLSDGEALLRRALACDPEHLHSHFRLAFVLGMTGRRWESVPHILRLMRADRFSSEHLIILGDVERVLVSGDLLTWCLQAAPDDPLALLGEARVAVATNELPKALQLLKRVVAALPGEVEAQVRLGALLLETGRREEFVQWQAGLMPAADAHPETWVIRGLWFLEQNETPAAVRCFWEAVSRDPDHRLANYRLGAALRGEHAREQAAPFLDRAEKLQHFETLIDRLFRNPDDVESMRQASFVADSLGRLWEAWGWARLALATDPTLDWPHEQITRLEPLLKPDLPRTVPAQNPARQVDLSSYVLPDPAPRGNPAKPKVSANSTAVAVRFAEVAEQTGIRFSYYNSPDPSTPGARIVEGTGGGVAALDYDGDSWPDLYFTQGAPLPPDENTGEFQDRLYRNLGDGRAADVTDAAGLGDSQFSQGIAAGDFNNDGFPDLYVANIGPNRLYRNNGDGTFADVTASAGIRGDEWTTSCLIADLNGDSWPDIYDVNYCAGGNLFSLVCEINHVRQSCSPHAFAAAPDQVYLSRGDGTFENVTSSAGIDAPNGYGLGIVAADFEGTGRLNLFVANDLSANFYFVNQTDERGGKLMFTERALSAGLAFDADGLAQACMGVAAGDADGNGLLDLYVSNYYNEADLLYLQQPGGLFADMIRPAGLRDASFAPLGFGTQFLDGELDGLPDLVLTNGHIDDLRALGQPYEMSPQYFRNTGGGRFVELKGSSLPGRFFERTYLGRGLARIDWNQDGKEDFAVSHIGSRAALVVNRTEGAGHFVALRLKGVTCDRDAIGTTVRVTVGKRTITSQLTAGDGYQASNERRIVVGLGNSRRVDRLAIRWLAGGEDVFDDVAADQDLLVIEGRHTLIPMPSRE